MRLMNYKNCFLGIPLPTELVSAYKDLQTKIKETDSTLTLQDSGKLEPHITIYYLGDQAEESLAGIAKIIDDSKYKLKKLTLKVGGMDYFPKQGYNILFLNVIYSKELIIFQQEIFHKLAEFYKDEVPLGFHPHMTVARMNTNRNQGQLNKILYKFKLAFNQVVLRFPISELVLLGIDTTSNRTDFYKRLSTFIIPTL